MTHIASNIAEQPQAQTRDTRALLLRIVAAVDTAERQSAEDTILGLQSRTFNALEVNACWSALRKRDTRMQGPKVTIQVL